MLATFVAVFIHRAIPGGALSYLLLRELPPSFPAPKGLAREGKDRVVFQCIQRAARQYPRPRSAGRDAVGLRCVHELQRVAPGARIAPRSDILDISARLIATPHRYAPWHFACIAPRYIWVPSQQHR